MADINKFIPRLLQWEGGYVNDPNDPGGATNMGVTLGTWKLVGYDKNGDGVIDANDIKLLTVSDVTIVIKKFYWDKVHADEIKSQSVAEMLVDWLYNSGSVSIHHIQSLLNLPSDGVVGPETLISINNCQDQYNLFMNLKIDRLNFILSIINSNPKFIEFADGWNNRINSYTWIG